MAVNWVPKWWHPFVSNHRPLDYLFNTLSKLTHTNKTPKFISLTSFRGNLQETPRKGPIMRSVCPFHTITMRTNKSRHHGIKLCRDYAETQTEVMARKFLTHRSEICIELWIYVKNPWNGTCSCSTIIPQATQILSTISGPYTNMG